MPNHACYRHPHWPTADDAYNALEAVGMIQHDRRNSTIDIHTCRHCGQWTYTRRPDHGDAA